MHPDPNPNPNPNITHLTLPLTEGASYRACYQVAGTGAYVSVGDVFYKSVTPKALALSGDLNVGSVITISMHYGQALDLRDGKDQAKVRVGPYRNPNPTLTQP